MRFALGPPYRRVQNRFELTHLVSDFGATNKQSQQLAIDSVDLPTQINQARLIHALRHESEPEDPPEHPTPQASGAGNSPDDGAAESVESKESGDSEEAAVSTESSSIASTADSATFCSPAN